MNLIILIATVIFFAMNMGASGIVPAFASAYGARIIEKKRAMLLFGIFVILGAIGLGQNVSLTLGKNLLPQAILSPENTMMIILAASLSLFLANILRIPQSTSQVTVGAITGVGLYFGQLKWHTLLTKIIPMWIILPLLSYAITWIFYRSVYPPRPGKLGIYEKIFLHDKKLKIVATLVSCYVAFSIGTNNVANAVGPLFGAGLVTMLPGLTAVSFFFGIGALLLGGRVLETASREIVPLGVFSSTLVSFVTGTLLLIASSLGVPQSLVQLNLCAMFAVSSLKNGHRSTLGMHMTQKTFFLWVVTPILSILISYFGLMLLHLRS